MTRGEYFHQVCFIDHKKIIILYKLGFNISSDLVSIFCTNAIFTPLLNLLNPWYFMRLAKRRQIQNEGENCLFTQAEANS